MEDTKQFKKLTKRGQEILLDYKFSNMTIEVLFEKINEDINRQSTPKSKMVRRSQYRGLVRKWFDLSYEDMKPIE